MDQIQLRDAYSRVKSLFPNYIISKQVLRVEEQLANNKSNYQFQLKQGNSSTDGPLENLLNQNDAFVLCALALGIKKQDTSTSPPRYGNYQPFFFPNPNVFVGAPAGQATESSALLTVYNGQINFATGSVERMKFMDTNQFLMVPQDRDINDGLAVQNAVNTPWSEVQPNFLIDGEQNNQFNLNLGAGDITAIDGRYTSGGAATATARNVLVLFALGLIIHNGSAAVKQAKGWE